jgi:hypothetical protein
MGREDKHVTRLFYNPFSYGLLLKTYKDIFTDPMHFVPKVPRHRPLASLSIGAAGATGVGPWGLGPPRAAHSRTVRYSAASRGHISAYVEQACCSPCYSMHPVKCIEEHWGQRSND